ncbi:hypothetical protein L1887_17479 [Cichorium endivia]|nr:hypothetical protein L1887_17479 [Cichorium endivia]
MSSSGVNLESFLIPLKEIKLATGDFNPETQIQDDGIGVIYQGQLSKFWQNRTVAIKRIDWGGKQGEQYFRNELQMISSDIKERNTRHGAKVMGTRFYMDPIHHGSGVVKMESDVYSFGVVLFEMLSGMLADSTRSIDDHKPQTLINLVRRYYDDGLEKLTDPCIINQIDSRSFQTFKEVAYQCISFTLEDRPKMATIIKKIEEAYIQNHGVTSTITVPSYPYQNLEIDRNERQFTELAAANPNSVYLDPIYNESGIVRAKLDVYSFGVVLFEVLSGMLAYSKRSIGDDQPQTLLNMVQRYYDDGCDNLMDPHIRDQINIHSFHMVKEIAYQCISLNLKDRPTLNRIIKSIEEALDIQINGAASTITHPNHPYQNLERFIIPLKDITLATEDFDTKNRIGDGGFGTNFYIDPIYVESGILRKESDVYSFGVVMFELVSGMLAFHRRSFGDGKPQHLINLVRRYYNDGLEKLIDPFLRDQIDSRCFYAFKELAFQCISHKSEERPTMDTIMERIEDAIGFQELMKCKET